MKVVLLICLLVSPGVQGDKEPASLCSSSVCIPSTYNKMDMPNSGQVNKEPFQVGVSMFLLDIYKINYEDFTMDLSVYVKFSWIDNRLEINKTLIVDEDIEIDVDFIEKLWFPDIYIYDLKEMRTRRTLSPEEGLRVKTANNTTKLTFIFEPEVIVVCPIDYTEFPFHSHTCELKMTSFSRSIKKMVFVTDHSWDPGMVLNKDKIRDYKVNVSYLVGDQTTMKGWTEETPFYSIAGLQIQLESRYDKYIYIYYIPTTMFTLTSWVSFLLPPTCYPARTTLLVTVFLCQIGVFNAVIKDTPNKDGGENKELSMYFAALLLHFVSIVPVFCQHCFFILSALFLYFVNIVTLFCQY